MLKSEIIKPLPQSELLLWVERQSGQKIRRCYQCGKCTAGCPTAYAMNLTPRQVMRALQLGLDEELIHSSAMWVCVFCHTCSARCPVEIDVARVMESLRLLVAGRNQVAEKKVQLFDQVFLRLVRRFGRIYELGLGGYYNLLSKHPLNDITLLPGMIARGKLPLLPPRVQGASQIKAIFSRIKAGEDKGKTG